MQKHIVCLYVNLCLHVSLFPRRRLAELKYVDIFKIIDNTFPDSLLGIPS